ncbi:MAG: hypothetical protein IPP23_11690 [Sphingomonadales bacterium]|nr:hypothetical protein [Sphingomonadales bacterium]
MAVPTLVCWSAAVKVQRRTRPVRRSFSTACAGNANGCYNLGLFCDDGTGVPGAT